MPKSVCPTLLLLVLCSCGADPSPQPAASDPPMQPFDPLPPKVLRPVPDGPTPQSSGLTRSLYILNEAGTGCIGHVTGFFHCVLEHTNWNQLANTYRSGEALRFGGAFTTGGVPCGNRDFQCAVNAGRFNITDYDTVIIIYPSAQVGGVNGSANLRNPITGRTVPINVAYVWSASGQCDYQTIYGGHEVFEAQTDGISADCCDGEVPSWAPAYPACLTWCDKCGSRATGTSACVKYGPTSCVVGGVRGTGSFGLATLKCGGATYRYQLVSPASHEFDGTCSAIVAH